MRPNDSPPPYSVDIEIKLQRAVALHGSGQIDAAAVLYSDILRAQPDHPDGLHLLGVIELQCGRPEPGLEWIQRSLEINPHQPAAVTNQGNALLTLKRPTAALACYERALSAWPDYALAHYGCGNSLSALGRPAEALPCFVRACERAPGFVEAWIGRGGVQQKLGRHTESLLAYERALELSPENVKAHLGRAWALLGLKTFGESARSTDRALELAPGCADAFTVRGHLRAEQHDPDAAIEAYDQALKLDPGCAAAWFSRGLALSIRARFAEAAASLQQALVIDPGYPYVQGAALHAQLQVCDWRGYAMAVQSIEAAVARNQAADFPFSFLALSGSPALQLQCARHFSDLQHTAKPLARLLRGPRNRIRVAYISGDFLEHPTSYLMAGVFEEHDRERFEIIGVSLRDDRNSPTARRVKTSFDRLVESGPQTDEDLARVIRDLDIDIAVDLMGYTGEHRSGIFAHRPAPIQVNYLGYPATMGSACTDYLIADDFLIPQSHRASYSECIAYLPDCFQANDERRPGAAIPTRAQMGLPTTGLVLCSFHSSYKLNPPMFDIWARLLHLAPDSVLWLVGGNSGVENNLRREARARGIEPERLVFAKPLPYPQHLARLGLADVCLDTLPFNGGATSSDALWAGVPVLTCAGSSFSGRMSGSLLHALRMPELVTDSLPEYERLASALVRSPARLADIRERLARNKQGAPLFNTSRFCRHLESAFVVMVDRHRQGLQPASFSVSAAASAAGP